MLKKREIKEAINLSLTLAKINFKSRNEGSYLGVFWYLLNPLLMFAFLYLAFSNKLGNNIPHYYLYLLLGIIMFNFFQNTTTESTRTIEENKGIIKSINFPKEALIASIVIKNAFFHFFEFLFFFIVLLFLKIYLMGIFYYSVIFFFMFFFTFGVSLIFSSISVYFIDFENIWFFASKILLFATPLFYAIEEKTKIFYFNLLNPLFYFISLARDLLIYSKTPESWLVLGTFFYTLFFLFTGIFVFKKLKIKFAENL